MYIYTIYIVLYFMYCNYQMVAAFEWWQQLKTVDSMYLQEKIIVISRRTFCYILLKRINF